MKQASIKQIATIMAAVLVGIALGYLLFGQPVAADSREEPAVLERLDALEESLVRIEDCACQEPEVITNTVYVSITEYLTTTVIVTQVIPVTVTVTSRPDPTSTQEPIPTQEPTPTQKRCNQGIGNGTEECSPGRSDNTVSPKHPHGPNDESPDAVPGNPGRKPEKVRGPKTPRIKGRSGK